MASDRWILTADEKGGRLIRVEQTDRDHLQVAIEDHIRNASEEHQHGRPSPRTGKTGHSYASIGHEGETMRKRFADEIAVWLEQQAERLRIERIAVFAPPRFLGALRAAWSPRLALRVDEHQADLSNLTAGELACHGAINDLVKDGRV